VIGAQAVHRNQNQGTSFHRTGADKNPSRSGIASNVAEILQSLLNDFFFQHVELAAFIFDDLLKQKADQALQALESSLQPRLRISA